VNSYPVVPNGPFGEPIGEMAHIFAGEQHIVATRVTERQLRIEVVDSVARYHIYADDQRDQSVVVTTPVVAASKNPEVRLAQLEVAARFSYDNPHISVGLRPDNDNFALTSKIPTTSRTIGNVRNEVRQHALALPVVYPALKRCIPAISPTVDPII
jgi:hypothetical protein